MKKDEDGRPAPPQPQQWTGCHDANWKRPAARDCRLDKARICATRLAPFVYQELCRLARGYMARERPNHTLQATALVNEAYLRLIDAREVHWQERAHFLALSARAMRRILVDHARIRVARKCGGQALLQFDETLGFPQISPSHLLELDDALKRLAQLDPRKSWVVELRFFGGLSLEETAEALKVSPKTVKRDWQLARPWLYHKLSGKH